MHKYPKMNISCIENLIVQYTPGDRNQSDNLENTIKNKNCQTKNSKMKKLLKKTKSRKEQINELSDFSQINILHLLFYIFQCEPDLLRRYGLLQHAVRHIQRSCHRRCDRYRDIFLAVSMTFSTGILPPMTSTLTFGRSVASTSAPRYFSPEPFWIPQPITCVTVIPVTPSSLRALRSLSYRESFTRMETLYMPVGLAKNQFFTDYFDGGIFL